MRLLLINYEFPPIGGGAGTATAALAREFATLGHEVQVLTSAFAELPREAQQDGYTVRRVPVIRRHADRCTVPEMLTFIASACWHGFTLARAWRPTACLAFFGIPGGPVALWLKWTCRLPYAVSLRGGDVPGHQGDQLRWHHRLTKPWIRLVWHQARTVVANSAGLRRQALQSAPTLTIPVIPNGVDSDRFRPRTDAAPSCRGSACGDLLLFVGRLSPEKGLHTLLDALAPLADRPWSLTLIGDGPERERLEAQAQRLGLAPRITFAGWVPRDQLPAHYQAADLFVFPSTDEGMPNTVLEAMASALPVLACHIPGCEDLVVDGETGLLVPPGNAAALTEALATLLADPARRARMATAARTRTLAHFTWRQAAESYLQLLAPLPIT